MNRRVDFVLPSFAGGGAERVALTLLADLDRDRFAPRLIVLSAEGPLADRVPPDAPMVDLRRPRLRNALPQLIRAIYADAVFSTIGYVNLALLAARPLLRSRLILREANLPSLSLPHAPHPRLMRIGYRRWYRRADRVIATSQRMADELAEDCAVPRARMSVLANPVDVDAIRTAAAAGIEQTTADGEAGPHFVAAGRLVEQKGYDRVIDAIAGLPADCRLTIFGDGPERDALQSRIEARGLAARVVLSGYRQDPWPDIATADAFLLPSRWEGMPNAALEALACGTPVIATAESGGFGEVADLASRDAIVMTRDWQDFERALAAVAARPARTDRQLRDSLLPAAYERRRVSAEFSRILDDMLSEPRR